MALFRVHDLARADDIRMRRRRALLLLAGIGIAGWTLVGPGEVPHHRHRDRAIETLPRRGTQAVARSFRLATSAVLVIDLPCAASLTLLPRPDAGTEVLVSARRGQEAALEAIGLTDSTLAQSGSCSGGGDVTLQMAGDRAFRVRQTGSTVIRGGSFGGAVAIDADGDGTVALGGVGSLADNQSGASEVTIGTISGVLAADLSGSGDLRVRTGAVSDLNVTSSGSGDIDMGRATIGGGRLQLDGSGSFAAATVAGSSLLANTSSSGDIAIDTVRAGDVQLHGGGSGDIVVHGGTIGHLVADRSGSGDLVVDAAIFSGQVSHDGSGDVRLPHAAAAVIRPPDGD